MVSDARRHAVMVPPWVRDALWARARAVPSLDLRFASTRSLIDAVSGRSLVTFTRATTGTYVGPAGSLVTAAVDEPRFQHDPVSGRCLGLLVEETRTNLLLNSATLSTQSVTTTATAHTLSFTGTGTVTLTGTSTAGPLVGTGTGEANRVALTFTPTAGTLTLTVSGTVSNAQLEAGSFRTSWIPTTGTSAQRQADIATIMGANFSGFYNTLTGCLYSSFATYAADSANNRGIAALDDGTNNNRVSLFVPLGAAPLVVAPRVVSGGSATNPANAGSFAVNAFANAAISYGTGTNVAALSVDGAAPTLASPSAAPVNVSTLRIGTIFGVNNLGGTISRIVYWPSRLPNHILQAVTR